MARLVLENVAKSFPGPRRQNIGAVRNLHLTVEDGELLVLVGPSGCGKTTTLRLIAGLETPDAGNISLDEKSWVGLAAKDRDVGLVFQNHALFPHLTVYENMALGLRLRKFPQAEIATRVREAAELLGLSGLLERRPAELSGGEGQRAALGRALARRPQVLLFDEPLSNLDAPLRLQLRGEIARLRRPGAVMILVTHDQAEALALADRVAVMRDGAALQVARPRELYNHPANRFVAGFIGAPPMNFFECDLVEKNGRLFLQEQTPGTPGFSLEASGSGRLRTHAGKPITLGLRPEHVAPAAENRENGVIRANLERVELVGAESLMYCSNGRYCFIARVSAVASPQAAQNVALQFDMEHARFFDPATGAAL